MAKTRELYNQRREVRNEFKAFVETFNGVEQKASDLAPRFMDDFRKWQAGDDGKKLSHFVRDIYNVNDDTTKREMDVVKRAIQRANYLKRLAEPKERPTKPTVEQTAGRLIEKLLTYVADKDRAVALLGQIQWRSDLKNLKIEGFVAVPQQPTTNAA
jgi:hypothetical protein